MPIGSPSQSPDPKSGCSGSPAPIWAIRAAEFFATGRDATGARQTLLAGATAHLGAPAMAVGLGLPAADASPTVASAEDAARHNARTHAGTTRCRMPRTSPP